MKQTIVQQPNREEFIKFISDTLTGKGFTKDPEKEIWIKKSKVMVGGGVVIINGQRSESPGEEHIIKQYVEVYGDGEMKDDNTLVTESFIEVNFDIEENNLKEHAGPTFCLFFNDQILFRSLLNKIFNI